MKNSIIGKVTGRSNNSNSSSCGGVCSVCSNFTRHRECANFNKIPIENVIYISVESVIRSVGVSCACDDHAEVHMDDVARVSDPRVM